MDKERAVTELNNALKGFHGRFKRMYGQVCLRVDESTYLSTGGNKILCDTGEDSFELCNMSVGDLAEIFGAKADVNAIIFGCTPDIVKVSGESDVFRASLEDLAMLTGPVLQIIPDSSPASIIAALENSDICLIKGVGAVAACSNLKKAVAAIQIIQKSCEAEVHGEAIGGTVPLSDSEAESCRSIFLDDYVSRNESRNETYIGYDEEELRLRGQIMDYGKELIRSDLNYGSWGNLSVRLNDKEMLISPSSMDYFDVRLEDIVRVNIETLEHHGDRQPSGKCEMHAAVYREFPDCGAIINTYSNALSTFAACEVGFTVGSSELKNLIGDVHVAHYSHSNRKNLPKAVTDVFKKTHACILPHQSGVFYGPSLEVVFAIAGAVEKRAQNLLNFDEPILKSDEEE